jgi:hypothetical protein
MTGAKRANDRATKRLFAMLSLCLVSRITTATEFAADNSPTRNVLRGSGTPRFTGNDNLISGRQEGWKNMTEESDYDGSVEVVTAVDDQALQKCLQRRDLEEVFGFSEGVICTCIGMAPIDFDDQKNRQNQTDSSVQVEIVVQLTCTDAKSRFNTNAGQLQYCIPKDDNCNVDSQQFCCGNRYCDLQRSRCVAPASSTSVRNGVSDLKIGRIDGHRDDPDREEPSSSESNFVRTGGP